MRVRKWQNVFYSLFVKDIRLIEGIWKVCHSKVLIGNLFIYQKIRLLPLGHDVIFLVHIPVYTNIYEFIFFFESNILNGTIYSYDSLSFLIIFYTHHIFMVLLFLESPSRWIQRKFYYYFMTAPVFCCYGSHCVTHIPSLSSNINEVIKE